MKSWINKLAVWPGIAVFVAVFGAAVFAQSHPLLQDIQVQKGPSGPAASSDPLVKKTSSVSATAALNAVKTSFPVLADTAIPGHSGSIG